MFRRSRETMIALRARHEALEVTRDIAYPPLQVHPPQPVIPLRPGDMPSSPPPPRPPNMPEWWMPDDDHVAPSQRSAYVTAYAREAPPSQSMLADVLTADVLVAIVMILLGLAVILMCKYG